MKYSRFNAIFYGIYVDIYSSLVNFWRQVFRPYCTLFEGNSCSQTLFSDIKVTPRLPRKTKDERNILSPRLACTPSHWPNPSCQLSLQIKSREHAHPLSFINVCPYFAIGSALSGEAIYPTILIQSYYLAL